MLLTRLHSAVRGVIASAGYITEAIVADGSVVEVPRSRAGQLKIDLENDALSTMDGGILWRSVMVRAASDILGVSEKPLLATGRKRKWDWDGAMAYLVAQANHPDGLPPLQADVERLVADYFERRNDGVAPTESLIREKVQLIYGAIEERKSQR